MTCCTGTIRKKHGCVDRKIRRRIADDGLRVGRQRVLAVDLRLAAVRGTGTRPDIQLTLAGALPLIGALLAVVFKDQVFPQVGVVDYLAGPEFHGAVERLRRAGEGDRVVVCANAWWSFRFAGDRGAMGGVTAGVEAAPAVEGNGRARRAVVRPSIEGGRHVGLFGARRSAGGGGYFEEMLGIFERRLVDSACEMRW